MRSFKYHFGGAVGVFSITLAAICGALALADEEQAPDVGATATIKMADGTIDGSILQPYDNAWLYTVTNEAGKVIPQGIWSDHLQGTTVDGKPALMRVQGMTYVNGKTSSTINIFDSRTLQPYSSRQQGTNGETQSRKFDGAHLISTRVKPGGGEVNATVDLRSIPYDFNGGMYGIVLASLPLREGLMGRFDSVGEFEDKATLESFRVVGREDVAAGAHGVVHAWKVESDRPGQYRMTFWLSKSAPYVIKLEYKAADRPLIWDWTMI